MLNKLEMGNNIGADPGIARITDYNNILGIGALAPLTTSDAYLDLALYPSEMPDSFFEEELFKGALPAIPEGPNKKSNEDILWTNGWSALNDQDFINRIVDYIDIITPINEVLSTPNESNLNVFPNPTSDILRIEMKGLDLKPTQISIFNSIGCFG